MAWLEGWAKRVKLTIDQNDIDDVLANFPILIYLSVSSGHSGKDISCVFDELTSDDNRKKIAVTKSDGTTQCYVEIEKWDDANEKAWLWVKVPSIASDADTDLYLYYDSTHADNTDYVGDTNDEVAGNVWDANFVAIYHMRDGADNQHIYDSTLNDNDGTKGAAGAPAQTTSGKIADAQDFDGQNDYINVTDDPDLDFDTTDSFTVEIWIKGLPPNAGTWGTIIGKYGGNPLWELTAINGAAGNICIMIRGSDGIGLSSVPSTSNVFDNTNWYHIVGVRNVSEDNLRIYVNGAQEGDPVTDATIATLASASPVKFGFRSGAGGGAYFDGIIDETRISKGIARPAAWLKATYETGRDHLLDFGSEEEAPAVAEGGAQYVRPTLFGMMVFRG